MVEIGACSLKEEGKGGKHDKGYKKEGKEKSGTARVADKRIGLIWDMNRSYNTQRGYGVYNVKRSNKYSANCAYW